MVFWLAYFLLCAIVAYIGKDTRLGFWGVFVAGMFITPFISFAMVILFGPPTSTGVK